MDNLIQIISVPVIAAIVYGALAGYKLIVNGRENWIRIIPVIAGVLGVILGIIAFYAAPGIIAADNVLTAILIGGASGLAATGANQVWKQLFSKPDTDKKDREGGGDGKSNPDG